MPIEFRRVLTPGIAQLSYLVGDSGAGVAAVVDPRPDCDVYLCHARELGVAITHILETHIHADFMSGARELADRLGHARVYLSREGDAHYGFEHKPIGDGDVVELGKLRLTARATPGHTPEHLAFELANEDSAASPWGVLTGDSLFVNSVGRPDLMGDDETDALARRLFETMQGYYKQLDPGVIIYPAHGHGSECGPKIADRLDSSIGYELAHNPYLKTDSLAAFRRRLNADAPPEPTHYRRLKTVNAQGPPILGAGPAIPPLTPKHFREAMGSGTTLVIDTRHMLAFGGGHIAGALNLGFQAELSPWAGWMIDPEKRILLVLNKDSELDDVRAMLVRVGLTHFAGYLAGGMTAWSKAGYAMQPLPQITVEELNERRRDMQIIDVRKDDEWNEGHIPGAQHTFVPDLPDQFDRYDRERPTVTYCASGYRSNIAASLLQRHGFRSVHSVPGSFMAWTSAGLPVAQNGKS